MEQLFMGCVLVQLQLQIKQS